MKRTMTLLTAASSLALMTASAQADVVISTGVGFTVAEFSLSNASTSPFDDAGNLITVASVTASSELDPVFAAVNVINGKNGVDGPGAGNLWVAANGDTDPSVTFTFSPGTDIAGLLIEWGFDDRDDGDYDISVDGTSIGSISVANDDSATAPLPDEAPTYLLFDSLQTDVSEIKLSITPKDNNNVSLGNVSFYAIPEPSSLALLGLGGLLVARRRRG